MPVLLSLGLTLPWLVADIAPTPNPVDGGQGTVGTLLFVAAVVLLGFWYFRRRRS